MGGVTLAIAHRGAPTVARENTPGSFEAACRHGADMIELDLRRTRDGTIVVLHDATLDRLWGDERAVSEVDAATVAGLGGGDERIPTLAEVLDQVAIPLMVDFTEVEVVDGAVRAVEEAGAMDRCLFVTWNVEALRRLRGLSAVARIGLTWVHEEGPAPRLLAELGAEFWNPTSRLVTAEAVDGVHRLGVGVSTWTVDEPDEMARVCEAGVDAVVSNDIAGLRLFLSSRRDGGGDGGGVG